MKKIIISLFLIVALAFGLTACSSKEKKEDDKKSSTTVTTPKESTLPTLAELTASDKDLSMLKSFIETADIGNLLTGQNKVTMFAPTNEAFSKIPADKLQAFQADKQMVMQLFTGHVVMSEIAEGKLKEGDKLTTIANTTLTVGKSGDKLTITNDTGSTAEIVSEAIETQSGYVYKINSAMLPAGQ